MWSVALDLSGSAARLAAVNGTGAQPAMTAQRPMRGRDAAELATWLLEHLHQWGIDEHSVQAWSVGSGPGSFTGMRLAAALVQGIVARREGIAVRCVPTALAIAGEVLSAGKGKIAVLYDGRNSEILVYGLEWRGDEWVPAGCDAILNAQQAQAWFAAHTFDGYIALEADRAAIGKVAPSEVMAQLQTTEDFSLEPLIRSTLAYTGDLTDLVYLRPAVFTN